MTDADPWIDALRAAHDDIAEVARHLEPAGLARPSGASEWHVADVLGHLGSGGEIAQAGLDAALEHRDPPGPDANPPIWDRWNALDDEGKAAGFVQHDERLVATFEGIDPATRDSLRIGVFYLPEPIDLPSFAGLRLSEMALHGWDVHVATDPAAVVLPSAAELLIDRSGAFIGFFGRADALDGTASLRVETTGPARVLELTITDTVALAEPSGEGGRDGVLRVPAEAWLRLVAGRLAADHTPADVVLASDAVTLDDLRRVFPGY